MLEPIIAWLTDTLALIGLAITTYPIAWLVAGIVSGWIARGNQSRGAYVGILYAAAMGAAFGLFVWAFEQLIVGGIG
jgi:hypothetical protein